MGLARFSKRPIAMHRSLDFAADLRELTSKHRSSNTVSVTVVERGDPGESLDDHLTVDESFFGERCEPPRSISVVDAEGSVSGDVREDGACGSVAGFGPK